MAPLRDLEPINASNNYHETLGFEGSKIEKCSDFDPNNIILRFMMCYNNNTLSQANNIVWQLPDILNETVSLSV